MFEGSISVETTAKVLAVIALVVALFSTVTVNFSARQLCRDVQEQNAIVYKSQDEAIKKVESGVQDKYYQRVYGDEWKEVKKQQLKDARVLRDRFEPRKCYLPITSTFH